MSSQQEIEWPLAKVRQTFIEFFQGKEHTFVPSSPTVPHNDPTLLFANAGMNQFKAIFLNEVTPEADPFLCSLKRACNSQKCIRAGGKHNDLDDVGNDTYHHTMFEMLGNWSFGDFFKKEAIDWCWELLVDVFKLDPSRLYATYYEGHEQLGIPPDLEARDLWLQYLPASRVLPFGKDNFWEMGDTGPCGPCTEVHYDHVGGRDASHLVNMDDPEVIEIWNLVFMQYNRVSNNKVLTLPAKHVDTGAGLERVAAVLQGKRSNYDTDLWQRLFKRIQEVSGARAYTGKVGAADEDKVDTAYRVVADHIRTLVFAINDGCVPSSTGRGYVLRRILRRGVRYMNDVLKAPPRSFQLLIDAVIDEMGPFFTELQGDMSSVVKIISEEEASFVKTLKGGVRRFEQSVKDLKPGDRISGAVVFKLYDTYGFPVDLTHRMAEERGLEVDEKEFEQLKESIWTTRTKLAGGAVIKLNTNEVDALRQDGVAATNDAAKYEVENDDNEVVSDVVALYVAYEAEGESPQKLCPPPVRIAKFPPDDDVPREVVAVDEEKNEHKFKLCMDEIGILTSATNFYGESGGQVYDTGSFTLSDGTELDVVNVQIEAYTYVVHMVAMPETKPSIAVGDTVRMSVDVRRRMPIMANHTSTHLLNHALRAVVGEHCEQKGSKVKREELRFDVSHGEPLTIEQCAAVDAHVQQQIQSALKVYCQEADLEKAKTISGVRQMFGERYPDPVRVVSIGVSVDELMADPTNEKWKQYAVEFCGGTHLKDSSEASAFAVIEDTACGAGLRRIVAVTGSRAKEAYAAFGPIAQHVQKVEDSKDALRIAALYGQVQEIEASINTATIPYEAKLRLRDRVAAIRQYAAERWKKFSKQAEKNILERMDALKAEFDVAAPRVHVELVEGVGCNAKILNKGLQKLAKLGCDVPVVIVSPDPVKSKIQLLAAIPGAKKGDALTANGILDVVTKECDGRGGGKPHSAQLVLNNMGDLDKALELLRAI